MSGERRAHETARKLTANLTAEQRETRNARLRKANQTPESWAAKLVKCRIENLSQEQIEAKNARYRDMTKEQIDARNTQNRMKYAGLSPEKKESFLAQARKANLPPDVYEYRIAKGRVKNMTPRRCRLRKAVANKWARLNPWSSRNGAQRRMARSRDLPATLTSEQWTACLKDHGHCCAYCGVHQMFCGVLHQEHLVPMSIGGGYVEGNIAPACQSCNSRKGTLTAVEFIWQRACA